MDGEVLERYKRRFIRLVKDDGFVISGVIKEVHESCIVFRTDSKELVLSFERIKEIVPLRDDAP